VKHHGIPVVHSKPRTPQTNGLIEQANGVLKSKILAWMTEMQSTEWWLALPEAILSMNRQVHSTTGKSPYEIVFKQLMPDRPRISTAQRSTAEVVEYHDLGGLEPFIDPALLISTVDPGRTSASTPDPAMAVQRTRLELDKQRDEAVRILNQEVIANTQHKVSAMESRYNKVKKVEVFEEGDLVRLKIPVEDRCTTDNKRIFCRVIEVKHRNRYVLQCQYGILHGLWRTKNMDRLAATIPHHIPPYKKDSHRELTLREAARIQSPAQFIQVRCGCKGDCATIRCKCFKSGIECTLHCHGRIGGANCTNTGGRVAPTGTFHLIQKEARAVPKGSQQIAKRRWANTRGDSANIRDHLEEEEELSEESDGNEDSERGEDSEQEEDSEDNDDSEENDASDEDEDKEEDKNRMSSAQVLDDIEHSVIVVAQRC
jgi:hypothetical protein